MTTAKYVVGFRANGHLNHRRYRAGVYNEIPNDFRYTEKLHEADVFDTHEAAQAEADRTNKHYDKNSGGHSFARDEVWNLDALRAELRILEGAET